MGSKEIYILHVDRRNTLYYISRNRAILECVMETADLTYQDLRTSLIELRGKTDIYKCVFQRPLKIPLAALFLSCFGTTNRERERNRKNEEIVL